jgi:hypothetical protein
MGVYTIFCNKVFFVRYECDNDNVLHHLLFEAAGAYNLEMVEEARIWDMMLVDMTNKCGNFLLHRHCSSNRRWAYM